MILSFTQSFSWLYRTRFFFLCSKSTEMCAVINFLKCWDWKQRRVKGAVTYGAIFSLITWERIIKPDDVTKECLLSGTVCDGGLKKLLNCSCYITVVHTLLNNAVSLQQWLSQLSFTAYVLMIQRRRKYIEREHPDMERVPLSRNAFNRSSMSVKRNLEISITRRCFFWAV